MSDLKPGALVLLDYKKWPLTSEINGLLWIFVEEVPPKDHMLQFKCRSVATGALHIFDRGSLTVDKEQKNNDT